MELKLILVTMFCLYSAVVKAQDSNDGIKFETGGKLDKSLVKSIYDVSKDDTESSGSGSDTEDILSGSGSGDDEIILQTQAPPVKKTDSTSTVSVIVINSVESTPASTTREDSNNNRIPEVDEKDPTADPNNKVESGKTKSGANQPSGGVKFEIGIIIGVVVGAVLAILVIVFLVYRLRKKDEGSYSLDEQSSQAFIRDDKTGQGKEYYA